MKAPNGFSVSRTDLLAIGIGTVFGTYILLVIGILAYGSLSLDPLYKAEELFGWFIVIGGVGGVVAVTVCIVASVPSLLIWEAVWSRWCADGYDPRRAALWTTAWVSLLGTGAMVVVAEAADFMGFVSKIALSPLPVAISVMLASRQFSGNRPLVKP